MFGWGKRLTPLEEAQRDATARLNKMYAYLSAEAGVQLDWYGDNRRKYHSLIRPIEDREGQKQFLKDICAMGTIMPMEILLHFRGDFRIRNKWNDKEAYKFIQENAPKIQKCRDLYMQMYVVDKKINMKTVGSQIREKVIDFAYKYKDPPVQLPAFIRLITPQIIKLPDAFSFSEMYDIYLQKLGLRKTIIDEAENFIDYTQPEEMSSRKDDKYALDMRYLRQKYSGTSPWKTAFKTEDYANKHNWNSGRLARVLEERIPDSFDMRKQRKLMKHYVSGRYGFVFDYFLTGQFRYLLAININTRKAYFAIPKEIYRIGHNWSVRKKGEWMPTGESAVDSVKHLLELTPIKSVLMDNEGAFVDVGFRQFLDDNGIEYRYVTKYNVGRVMETQSGNQSRSTHSTSLIDRLIRTLRLMNHNLGNKQEIEPPMLNFLIEEYNNSVHGTLSKLVGRPVTPNMVDNDVALENEIVRKLRVKNFFMESNPDYEVSKTVRVFNDLSVRDFEKVKPKLIPGKWEYVGRENGLFKLQQNGHEIMVPRWMIKNSRF